MRDGKIDAQLALRSEGRLLVGRDRITLLEAVAEHGSITKAAEAVGFSYKTAWDAVTAINNLLPTPAFVTKTGGRKGGGAEVTEEGRRLIVAFRRLEEKLARISAAIAEEGLHNLDDLLLWGMAMKVSARNALRCEVSEVRSGAGVGGGQAQGLARHHHHRGGDQWRRGGPAARTGPAGGGAGEVVVGDAGAGRRGAAAVGAQPHHRHGGAPHRQRRRRRGRDRHRRAARRWSRW